MIAISILINSLPFVPWDNVLLRMLVKLALLPFVVGLGYEFLMYAGKHDNTLVRILSTPGLWMQRITTREPDEEQLAVAIEALMSCMPDEFPEHAAKQKAAEEAEAADNDNAESCDAAGETAAQVSDNNGGTDACCSDAGDTEARYGSDGCSESEKEASDGVIPGVNADGNDMNAAEGSDA